MLKNKVLIFSLFIFIFTTGCSKSSSKESEIVPTFSEAIEKLMETTTIINKDDKTKIITDAGQIKEFVSIVSNGSQYTHTQMDAPYPNYILEMRDVENTLIMKVEFFANITPNICLDGENYNYCLTITDTETLENILEH